MTKLQLAACAAAAELLAFAVTCYAPLAHAQERAYAYYDSRMIENNSDSEEIIVTAQREWHDLRLPYEQVLIDSPEVRLVESDYSKAQSGISFDEHWLTSPWQPVPGATLQGGTITLKDHGGGRGPHASGGHFVGLRLTIRH